MARLTFKEINFRRKSREMLALCGQIITTYMAEGFRLTLRQLYYQLVSRNVIPNVERAYKNLGRLVSEGRLAGVLDWDGIEDRGRVPEIPAEWSSLRSLVDSAIEGFRLPRWEGQPYYVELWVEKDALAGVLQPLGDEFHVTVMVNRGYSSQSAMFDSAQRFRDATNTGHAPVILYLGDFDPSGEDMVRDIRDRLELFGVDIDLRTIAITEDQIAQYNPPPNPAKMSDSRARKFVDEHGSNSYEVDALPPATLQAVIREALEDLVDQELMDEIIEREDDDKDRLRDAMEDL